MTQQLLSLDLFIVNAIYNIITVLSNIPITGLVRLLCGASELIYRKGRLCRVIQRNYFPSHTETLLWKLCFKGSFNELWNMYYGFQAKSLYVCGFAVIPLWGWSSVTLNSSLFLPNISLFPSCSKPCACADYSGVALVHSSNFLSCFIWYFGCWVSTSVFCCVSEPRKLSDLQCMWEWCRRNQPRWERGWRRKWGVVAQGPSVSSWH